MLVSIIMMDMMLAVARRRRCCCFLTVHISESSNNGEEKYVHHPLQSIGIILNIICCNMPFMEMGSSETVVGR